MFVPNGSTFCVNYYIAKDSLVSVVLNRCQSYLLERMRCKTKLRALAAAWGYSTVEDTLASTLQYKIADAEYRALAALRQDLQKSHHGSYGATWANK